MRKLFALALTALLAMPWLPAGAATQWCGGTIQTAFVGNNGRLVVLPSWRGDYITLCDVNGAWRNLSASVCKAWVADVFIAVQSRRSITVAYGTPVDCGSVATYDNAPAPWYVNLQ